MQNKFILIFDLHKVIADKKIVLHNYREHFYKLLKPIGISKKRAADLHDIAFEKWHISFQKAVINYDNKVLKDDKDIYEKLCELDRNYSSFVLNKLPKVQLSKNIVNEFDVPTLEYTAQAHGDKSPCYPDVEAVLKNLTKNELVSSIHIASSSSTFHIEGVLTRSNLTKYFSSIHGWNSIKSPKRSSRTNFFDLLLKKLDLFDKRSSCVFIGDTLHEYQLSKQLQSYYIHINRSNMQIIEAFPSIPNLDLLPDIISSF